MFQYIKLMGLGGAGIPSFELIVNATRIPDTQDLELRSQEGTSTKVQVPGELFVENVVPYVIDGVEREVRLLVPEAQSGFAPSPAVIRGVVQRLTGQPGFDVANWPTVPPA